VLKGESRKALSEALRAMVRFAETREIPRRNLTIDVDALHLM
jgi:primosomal protein N' (replication factor Y)